MIFDYYNSPDELKHQIDLVVDICKELLSDNLVGIYLHGSLSMGCFNPSKSDIDLLIVIKERMSPIVKITIAKKLLDISSQGSNIEISILIENKLKEAIYPLHYDFHFSEYWRKKLEYSINDVNNKIWKSDGLSDHDLSAHIRVLEERGITLYGKEKNNVFTKVSDYEYLKAISFDFEDAYERIYKNPEYYILNTCRVLYFLDRKRVSSKKEAGEWYLKFIDDRYTPLVNVAMNVYIGKVSGASYNNNLLKKFVKEKETKIAGNISGSNGKSIS